MAKQINNKNLVRKFWSDGLVLTGWVILSLCYLGIAWSNNRIADTGQQLADIQEQERSLKIENMLLENKLASASSFKTIEPIARALGFTPIKNVEFLK